MMEAADRNNRTCRGCGPQYEVTEAQIDRILQAPMFKDPSVVVPASIYEERLSACEACEHLQQGQTCLLCGCFVRVSAYYRNKSCPNVKNRSWGPYTK